MIATEAILVIAFCLAVIAAIGIRVAMSLADIEKSLDRVANSLETGGFAGPQALAGAAGKASTSPQGTGLSAPDDAEIAAAIAAAARFRKASPAAPGTEASGPAARVLPRAATPMARADDGNGIVDATAERTPR